MSGIRVSGLPDSSQVKLVKMKLQIYFGKTCNGGGKIQHVYYPVLGNEAVIIFEDPEVVDTVMTKDHFLEDKSALIVKRLPQKHIFPRVNTELDPDISCILQASRGSMYYIKDTLGIDVLYDESNTKIMGLSGSWYQVEMAWQFIDNLIVEQKQLQSGVQVKMASMQSQRDDEMDLDEDDTKAATDQQNGSLGLASSIISDRNLTDKKSDCQYWRDKPSHTYSDSDEDIGERHFTAAKHRGLSFIGISGPFSQTLCQITNQSDEDIRSFEPNYNDNADEKLSHDFEKEAKTMKGRERRFSGHMELDVGSTPSYLRENKLLHSPLLPDNPIARHHRHMSPLSPQDDNSFVLRREEGITRQSFSLDFVPSYGHDDRSSDHYSSLDSQHDHLDLQIRKYEPDKSTPKERGHKRDIRIANNGQNSGIDGLFSTRKGYQRGNIDVDVDLMYRHQHREMSNPVQASVLRPDSVPVECQDENLNFKFCVGSIQVTVLFGNILKERNHGIVNAANGSLVHAAGVAGAISRAAGPEMESECQNFISKNGTLRTSQVIHTSAGGQLSKEVTYILHAVGPIWIGESLKDIFHYELTKTFMNCFIYANERIRLESLSLPLISSGIFGAPLDECVRCFLDGLLVYSKQGMKTTHLKKIHLIFKDPDSTMLCIAILRQLLDNGIEDLTKQALEMYSVQEINKKYKAWSLNSFCY